MVRRGGFAVFLRDRCDIGGILMIVDDRREANEIAIDLRQQGHDVDVRELAPPPRPARDEAATNGLAAETA